MAMLKFRKVFGIWILFLLAFSCAHKKYSQEEMNQATQQLNAFFAQDFQKQLARSPEFATELGLKTDYHRLDDDSEAAALKEYEEVRTSLKELRTHHFDALDTQGQISYRIFEWQSQEYLDNFKFRHHNYPVNQMFGIHADLPSFMMNMHAVDTLKDAWDYVARLEGFGKKFDDTLAGLEIRRKKGIIPPAFVFPLARVDMVNIITGQPFNGKTPSPLWKDIQDKVKKLKVSKDKKDEVLAKAKNVLLNTVLPSYQKLIQYFDELAKEAPQNIGAWTMPNGDKFYERQLSWHSSSSLSAEAVHQLGLEEVARIHDEIRGIMKKVKFSGNLQDFFNFVLTDKRFQYPNTATGKQAYLKDSKKYIDVMETRLKELFTLQPQAKMIVKAVEPYREKSSGGAFYERPSNDGKRPGVFYVNLYDLSSVVKYEMEALAYHEGIPGHHMQIATSIELQDIPEFRKHNWITAYGEGWALYAELIPKEIGLYTDPYSDFGRLTMELWRACRLVVDTGIHYKRWTYDQALDYLSKNTPAPKSESVNSLNRYFVWPGQAVAYKMGMIKIQQLRAYAEKTLGKQFNLRAFHDEILKNGAMPMTLLDERIKSWVAEQ